MARAPSVRALTGTDPDRLKEEQERGITIDLGFAHRQVDGSATEEPCNLAFIDVPGHERFVKNMLAGVGGMDLVLLIVAADESVMPQTREHFHICRLLHVPRGLVVLTKSDLVDEETLAIARLDVRELVADSFLADAPVVAVSSRTGDGLAALSATLAAVAASVPVRRTDGPVRLPVDRVFSMKGFGTVATGTLVSGRVEIDQGLAVLPRQPPGQGPRAAGARPFAGRGGGWQAGGHQSGRRRRLRVGARRYAGGSGCLRADPAARCPSRPAARRAAAAAGLARALSLWHRRGPGTRGACGAAAGRGLRANPSRITGDSHPRRPLHPEGLLSARHDRRRRRPGSAAATSVDSQRHRRRTFAPVGHVSAR